MSPELKILAFIRHYPPPFDGGGYYYNYHLFKELQREGCNITILTHSESINQPDDEIKIVPIQSIKTGRFVYRHPIFKIADFVSNVRVIRKHLSNTRYDYIFTDAGYMVTLTVYIANLLTRIPVIGINLGEEIKVIQQTTRFRGWLQRQLLKSHCINISISSFTHELLSACGLKNSIVTIYPFIEKKIARDKTIDRQYLVDTYDLDKKSMIIGFLGRHVTRKGVLNLIEAVERLLQEKNQIILLIAGQGTETDRIKERIARSDKGNQVKMIGPLLDDSKDCFFNGIDIFAMPNYEDPISGDTEGFGIVFIEAAQYGTPVIGGNAGGVVEAVNHQYNGYLVDGKNINTISEAISRYYQNPSLRKKHGENGIEWAKKFIKSDPLSPLRLALRDIGISK